MELFRLSANLLAIASALAAALSLGGGFSGRLDVLTHFVPLYLAGGLIAIVVQLPLAERDRVTLAFGAAAMVLSALIMGPELIARLRQSNAALERQTVKIIQFNLWSHNVDPVGTAAWIARQDADVVVLEEVIGNAVGVPDLLARAYPYRTPGVSTFPFTTVILSKARPRESGAYPSPDSLGRHSGAWATFGDGRGAYAVVGTHALWPAPPGPQQAQSGLLAGRLGQFDRRALIVAGDFNSTPWSFALHRQDTLFGLPRRTRALFSWPVRPYSRYRVWSPMALMPIDHVYAGTAWKTVSVTRGPRLGSDLLPIVAVLTR